VSQEESYHLLSPEWQELWCKKANNLGKGAQEPELSYEQNAAIYAEFGKIVCISLGIFVDQMFKVKSCYGDDEAEVLLEFIGILSKMKKTALFCGHNIKEFDLPYIGRRMLVNQMMVPKIMNLQGVKPWDIAHIDTMQLWKFGDYKSYTSLDLLAHTLDVPTSKSDIDGSQVGYVYWHENGLKRIVEYCQRDIVATANIYLRMNQKPLIDTDNIIISNT
jgi:predicted PolB exonuclease-like 3'-5' exonuclease